MMKDTITFRYRMSDRDVFYGGGVVNGARSITLMEDAAKRLMAKTFGNTGRCVEVKKVRLYTPCLPEIIWNISLESENRKEIKY